MASRDQLEGAPPTGHTPICAIGASAGGVTALQNLFRLIPPDLGLAYVVILHLSPNHPSAMQDILSACTRMPVLQVEDGPELRPNCVYVIPPDRELAILGGHVTARPFREPRNQRAPIDIFFRSVAAQGDGIAVILTGAGSDGALGVRSIKEAGGVVMVQEPAEAEYPMMPRNAIATGAVDFVAPLARLAERIGEVARSKDAVRSLDMDGAANDLRRIIAFLRARTGHDFSSYKRATVMRRVLRRMQVRRADSLAAYAEVLRDTPEEAAELFSDLLISVTSFFRDAAAFQTLERQAIGPIFDDLDEGGVRAWVVGCATGEEAYSVAILLLEEAARRKAHTPIQVFASDLDEGALATAREGRYPRSIEADVSDERLARFFIDEGAYYRVRKEVREAVLFTSHSALKDPPFMRLDLVTCRNLLIYLERVLQQQLCAVFHFSLRPHRYLFLGSAETVDSAPDVFRPVDRDARLYQARPQATQSLPVLPQFPPIHRAIAQALPLRQSRNDTDGQASAVHSTALERVAPPSVAVDERHDILHLSPTAGRFILHSAGPFSNRLSTVVRPELRLDLKIALSRAIDQKLPTLTQPVVVAFDDARRRVAMQVAPAPAGDDRTMQALVFFLDGGPVPEEEPADLAIEPRPDEMRRLHAELKAAQEALVASRNEHELSIQELRAANEELQSVNEEYRSTAEELETSKEELQSINEELQTVNAELKTKLEGISVAHNDLQNLTASTEIGTLFLDTDLRIRMFTPPIVDLFNVTTGDLGRPITNFTHRLESDAIERDVLRVIRDLVPFETEVRSKEGRWYMMRLRPYRTVENRIDGAVVTFVDLTARREAEIKLSESERRLRSLVQSSSQALYWMDADWGVMHELAVDGVLSNSTGDNPDWLQTYIHPDDRTLVMDAIRAAIDSKGVFELEHRISRADGTTGWVLSRAVPTLGDAGEIKDWFGSASDVTERKAAEMALRQSEARFRRFGDASSDVLWIAEAKAGALIYVSPAYDALFGEPRERVLAAAGRWLRLVHPEDRQAAAALGERLKAGEPGTAEYRIRKPSGGERWLNDTGFPIAEEDGRVSYIGGIVQDVTDQRAARERQAVLLAELQHRVRNTLAVVRSIIRRTRQNSRTMEEYAGNLDGRIDAFARVQSMVTRAADAGVDLREMLAEELAAHGAREGERAVLDGPPLRLRSKAADVLGLALHELATNAAKYGALASHKGQVRVSWQVRTQAEPPDVVLEWKESSGAIDPEAPRRRGFGADLLERALTYELEADVRIAYEPDGVRCTVAAPLARLQEMGE